MRVFVQAKPKAREERLTRVDENHFVIAIKEPPVDGRANFAIARVLAIHFGVSPLAVRLVSGFSSRQKVFDVGV